MSSFDKGLFKNLMCKILKSSLWNTSYGDQPQVGVPSNRKTGNKSSIFKQALNIFTY